jgi:hypothetical protein
MVKYASKTMMSVAEPMGLLVTTGTNVERKKEDEVVAQLKAQYPPDIVERLLRYGYSYHKLASELTAQRGPAYDQYQQYLREAPKTAA